MPQTGFDSARAAPDVIIAGGGIGGLFAALALARFGLKAHILERDIKPQTQGAGIQLGPNAVKLIHALELHDDIADAATPAREIHLRCGLTGQTLTRLPIGAQAESRHDAPHLVVHRADLHEVLHTRARDHDRITLDRGVRVTGFEQSGDAVRVMSDKGSLAAGALIVADGVFSKLRGQMLDDSEATASGLLAWRALIEPDAAPPAVGENATGLWLLPHRHLVHYRVRGGKLLNLVAMTEGHGAPGGWDMPGDRDELMATFADAAEPLKALIEAAPNWYQWPLYERAPVKHYTENRVALLGDAAHPTLPCLAQGGAMAMEDGYVIARCLAESPNDPAKALRRYDRLRVARTGRVQRASRRQAGIYHLSGPARLARNATLRMAGKFAPAAPLRRYDWLYGYDPVTGPLEPPGRGKLS